MQRKLLTTLLLFALMLTMLSSTAYPTNPVGSPEGISTESSDMNEGRIHVTSNTYPIPMDISGNSYSDHPRITITSNSDFISQKASESWLGTGVEGDPIEITGYNFTSTSGDLISISNTDLHFTIAGHFVRESTENYYGISLSNVTHGNITNNFFDRASSGVYFNDVNFSLVQNNHFTSFVGTWVSAGRNNSISGNYLNTTDTSVMFYSSATFNNTVYNNTLLGSSYGVYLYGATENVVSMNNITQTSVYSLYLTMTTTAYNVITGNLIHDSVGSGKTGIYASSYAHNNTLNLNNITNITLSIRLSYSDNNTISWNQISNTTQAISVESSQWNEVFKNNISDVTDGFDGAFSLYVYKGANNTLHYNNVSNTDNAVFIYQSGQNNFHHNNMSDVRAFGFNMMTGALNTIYENEISNGTTAFYIHQSSTNNTLSRNSLQYQNQGIQLETTSHYNSFYENTIVNATNYGIDSTSSSFLTIYNNTIINSGLRGINIAPSSYHTIAFNELINNGEYGLYLDTGFGSQIYNNSIKYHSITGAYLISTNQYNVSFNIFANSTVGLSLVSSSPGYVIGNTFANNSDTGLLLAASDGIPVSDNLFSHNGVYGIRLLNSYGTPIENNTILSGVQHGIVIESGSDLNVIKNNEISNNGIDGIWVRFGPNTIRLNNISGNGVGINVDTANTNSIESNFIDGNTDGIRLVDADDNTILLNTVFNNSQYGIYSESGFPQENNGNHIYNNTVISNGVYGVWLYTTTRTTEVKWNDFINNTAHAADSNPYSYLNVWDGNFYDDWDHQQSYYVIGVTTNDYSPADLPLNPSQVHFMLSPSITSPVTGSDHTGDITITWDPAYDSYSHMISYTLSYSNNSGSNWYPIVSDLTNSSFYWNASSLAEGTEYQLRIVANDTIGTTSVSETGIFSIDTQAPRLGVVPSDFTVELSWDPMPVLNFSAYDSNPDWAHVQWLGSEVSEPVSWSNSTLEYLNFPEGSVIYGVGVHALYLVVYDISGHETWYLFYLTVIDTTAPTIVIPESNQTFELGPHGSLLTWTAYDLAAGTYSAYFNDSLDMTGSWVSNTGTELEVDGYMPGVYNVTIVFYDTSGNNVTHSINMTVIDTTAPVIDIFPSDDTIEVGTTSNFLNWTVIELDPLTYNVSINSVFDQEIVYTNGSVLFNIDSLTLGYYNITAVFFDNSGNYANDSVFINVTDTIAPVISAGNDIVIEYGSVGNVVNWTATDVLPNNYTVYLDAANWTSGFWSNGSVVSVSIDGLSVGNHTFIIHFADTSNNHDSVEVVISVLDSTIPSWVVLPENQTIELGSLFYYDVNASDMSALTYTINDTSNFTIDSLSGEITNATILIVGVYDIQITVTDSEGNVLTESITITVEDTVAPIIFTSPDDIQYTVGETGNVAIWTVEDLDPGRYTVSFDDGVVNAYTWTQSNPILVIVDGLSEGTHTVVLIFYDNSGNMITDSLTVVVVPLSTSTSTTPTTTTTPTTPPAEGSPMILLVGGGAAVAAIVVLGIILLKKKQS